MCTCLLSAKARRTVSLRHIFYSQSAPHPFMDCHHVRLAHSLSCFNYESLCQWKLLHSSSSLFDWQTLWGYCYLEHTVPLLWWRYQIAYSSDAFSILPLSSPCSQRKGLQW